FCEQNNDICNQYFYPTSLSLIDQIEKTGRIITFLLGVNSGLLPGIIGFLFVKITERYYKTNTRTEIKTETEATPILRKQNNFCRFFRTLKEKVLPSPYDIYLLPIALITNFGGCALLTFVIARYIRHDICSDVVHFTNSSHCLDHFPNATAEQLQEIFALSN